LDLINNLDSILDTFYSKVDPEKLVRDYVKPIDSDVINIGGVRYDLRKYRKVFLIAYGKASVKMASGIFPYVQDRVSDSYVIVDRRSGVTDSRFRVIWGNHPIPDESVYTATRDVIKLLRYPRKSILVIHLISGGGSSLFEYPAGGMKPRDIERIWTSILSVGADIHEINTVRRHLSSVKGGNIVKISYPSRTVSLILSDVVGNPLHDIASGPTAPDPTTFRDAYNVLAKYGLTKKWKATRYILRGVEGKVEDTPKPGDKVFDYVSNNIVGDISLAADKLKEALEEHGYEAVLVDSEVEGRVEEIADDIFRRFVDKLEAGKAYVFAGDVYTPSGYGGVGGAMQELALQLYLRFRDEDLEILAFDTDGLDGNSPAAGAALYTRDVGMGVREILSFLEKHDTYTLLRRYNHVVETGYTHTTMGKMWVLYKPG